MSSEICNGTVNSMASWKSRLSLFFKGKKKAGLSSALGEFSWCDWWEGRVITFEVPLHIIPLQCSSFFPSFWHPWVIEVKETAYCDQWSLGHGSLPSNSQQILLDDNNNILVDHVAISLGRNSLQLSLFSAGLTMPQRFFDAIRNTLYQNPTDHCR